MDIFSKAIYFQRHKLVNFQLHNFLKQLINIRDLFSTFTGCDSFIESNSPEILAHVIQSWMTQFTLLISLGGVIFCEFERILLLIYMVVQFV